MKMKKILILFIISSIALPIIGCNTKQEEETVVSTEHKTVNEGTEEKVETSISYELLEDLNMDEMFEKAKEDLVVDSGKRDIDKDSENLYVANKIILSMYENEKTRKEYEEKYDTTETQVIIDAITKDVVDYMNKELEK